MTQLQMFIPLTKIDAGKRLVYGVVTAETPDRGNEVCDYASTKPYYQKWSDEARKASGGKSLGNLRAMHGKVAAGRVEAIHFNDDDKQIEVCAKIIDEAEWAKVEAGVYTGFSRGGGYVKRWPDENDPDLMRYTASPCEISLVDLPCLPSATFAMIKADGAVETMKFASFDNAVEQVWMAGDGKTFKKKAEALAHQALLASSASMLGALERMENDLGKAAPGTRTQALERLRKCLGQEAFDAGRAIAALQIVFDVLAAEIAEGEDDEGQIAALRDAIVRLKDFIVAEISEDDEDDEQPLEPVEQAAAPSDLAKSDLAKIAETLEAARLERDAQKALLAELAPRLEKLGQRVEELARQPLPPPMLAGTRAVEKGAEARVEDLAATLAAMTGEQRAALLIKVAQSQPRALR
ncbi:MAG: hypothetical protein WBQ53_06395 [Methylocystis sp.]